MSQILDAASPLHVLGAGAVDTQLAKPRIKLLPPNFLPHLPFPSVSSPFLLRLTPNLILLDELQLFGQCKLITNGFLLLLHTFICLSNLAEASAKGGGERIRICITTVAEFL